MELADLDYDLPAEAIAQTPAEPRTAARLLIDRGPDRPPEHALVADLVDHLRAGDVLVVNETRVLPARLALRKDTGGAVEVLLLEPAGTVGCWEALVRPSRRVAPGTVLTSERDERLSVRVGDRLADGRRAVRVERDGAAVGSDTAEAALAAAGELPLPPYVHGPLADPSRYQTVFATRPGSVAAPTAGLHLTADLLAAAEARGAMIAPVELVVGLDTFRPITVDDPADHVIHTERYRVPEASWTACRAAERVVAVGTTSVRALESIAATGELSGRTDLFIHPPYRFAVVDVLLTNFHLPRSTLLLLVEAFIGPRWRQLYEVALAEGYRFLSLGDAMLLGAHE